MRLGGVREGGGDGSIDGTRARDDKGRDLEAAGVGDGEEVVEGDEHGDDDGGSHDHGPLEDEVVGDLGFDEAEGFHADLKGDGTEGYDDEEADEMPGGEDGRILGEEVVARREVEVEGGEAEEEVWESGEPREEEREDAEEVLDDRRQSEDADALEPDEGPGACEDLLIPLLCWRNDTPKESGNKKGRQTNNHKQHPSVTDDALSHTTQL
mmetsp:Transcript_30906/g.99716  ORF Transcript_30906/g.99716 Transcript_30906/m.99716 type:complete len:210 (+) Transcript_30906:299-928(+)